MQLLGCCTEAVSWQRVGVCRLYDTREKHLIESFVDDVLELVELQPNKNALVRHTHCVAHTALPALCPACLAGAPGMPSLCVYCRRVHPGI